MRSLIIILSLFVCNVVSAQQVYKLGIEQPSRLGIIIPDTLRLNLDEQINLDTLYNVTEGKIMVREWQFWDGTHTHIIDESMVTFNSNGVLSLSIIDENECTENFSIQLDIITDLEKIYSEFYSENFLHVYPNPSNGKFDIAIKNCLSGYSIQIINFQGIQVFNKLLDCKNNNYLRTISVNANSGLYCILLKKDKRIIYTKKVIIQK